MLSPHPTRETGKRHPIKYQTSPFFYLHTINAYEEDGHLVVDICCYARYILKLFIFQLPSAVQPWWTACTWRSWARPRRILNMQSENSYLALMNNLNWLLILTFLLTKGYPISIQECYFSEHWFRLFYGRPRRFVLPLTCGETNFVSLNQLI